MEIFEPRDRRPKNRLRPPNRFLKGRFIDVDGVRLHYVRRGNGRPLVLIHGNGSMIQDQSRGLIDLAAESLSRQRKGRCEMSL
jgi:hypothetical protein